MNLISLKVVMLVLGISTFSVAANNHMIVCNGSELTLKVRRELKFDKSINGWKNYWALVDYKAGMKSGTLNARIAWRKDPRPGYNAFVVSLMDKEEFDFRKQGLEGGSEGFGSIDSRDEIKGSFEAKWSTHKDSRDAPELQSEDVQLSCQINSR